PCHYLPAKFIFCLLSSLCSAPSPSLRPHLLAQNAAPKPKQLPPVTVAPPNDWFRDNATHAKLTAPPMNIAADGLKAGEIMASTSNRPPSIHLLCVDNSFDE
ncbi:hypothetical protein L0F63_006561, partial [Massospora cicadina]